jgi:hypothetical protein
MAKLKYLVKDTDRYGVVRYYVRVPGKPKVRIFSKPDTAEFEQEYRDAFGGLQVVPERAPVPDAEPGMLYVYIVSTETPGPSKIGITVRPEERLSQLQNGNPHKLSFQYLYQLPHRVAVRLERKLLREYRELRLQGEWFDTSAASLNDLLVKLANRSRTKLSNQPLLPQSNFELAA